MPRFVVLEHPTSQATGSVHILDSDGAALCGVRLDREVVDASILRFVISCQLCRQKRHEGAEIDNWSGRA